MNKEFSMMVMTDSFYTTWEIPQLPLPIALDEVEYLRRKNGMLNKDVLLTGLEDYLWQNPDQKTDYQPVISRVAFEAGLDHLRKQTGIGLISARHCFTVALQYDPRNVETLTRFAVCQYYLARDSYAEIMEKAIRLAYVAHDFLEEPFDYITIIHILLSLGEDEKAHALLQQIWEESISGLGDVERKKLELRIFTVCKKNRYLDVVELYYVRVRK